MMKRVFIFAQQALFAQGVMSLLGHEPALKVIGCEAELAVALRQIREMQPDVVILVQKDAALTTAPDAIATRFLGEELHTKIIALNLHDNTICIYQREQRVIKEVADLLAAIG